MKPIFWTHLGLALSLIGGASAQSSAAQEAAEKRVHIVEGPSVIKITGTSAVVKWKTDSVGANYIQYRPASGGDWKKGWVKQGSTEHWIPVKGLTPNTTYEYQILTRDGDVRTSGQFKTAAANGTAPDVNPSGGSSASASSKPETLKIIHGPVVEGTGDTWATIAWTTNTGGSSIVRYGKDKGSLSQTAESPYANDPKSQKQTHRVRLKGLEPGTKYYFVVDSGQGEGTGTETKSPVSEFTTKGKSH